MTTAELQKLSNADIKTIDVSRLVDINSVRINPDQQVCERVQDFIEKMKNPYCFLVGDTPVKISFKGTDKSLDNALSRYFTSLKK